MSINSLLTLFPESIKNDSKIQDLANSVQLGLDSATSTIPELLLYARLIQPKNHNFLPPLQRLTKTLEALDLEILEQLAWQFHLDFRELAKTNEELRQMVLSSIAWHRKKGTPSSLLEALNLFGYNAEIEEHNYGEDWAVYQLGLEQVYNLEQVKAILKIAKEMAPARCKFFRVYTKEFDFRPAFYSESQGYSYDYYSFYSGLELEVDDEDILVSFGRMTKSQSNAFGSKIFRSQENFRGWEAPYLDCQNYSQSNYSDLFVVNHGFSRSRLRSLVYGDFQLAKNTWSGAWDSRSWYKLLTIDRFRPTFSLIAKHYSEIEACYSLAKYSDHNAYYFKSKASLINNPTSYGLANYSDNQDLQSFYLDELFTNFHFMQSQKIERQDAQSSYLRVAKKQVSQVLLTNPKWQAKWDSRFWRAFAINSNIIHEEIL